MDLRYVHRVLNIVQNIPGGGIVVTAGVERGAEKSGRGGGRPPGGGPGAALEGGGMTEVEMRVGIGADALIEPRTRSCAGNGGHFAKAFDSLT